MILPQTPVSSEGPLPHRSDVLASPDRRQREGQRSQQREPSETPTFTEIGDERATISPVDRGLGAVGAVVRFFRLLRVAPDHLAPTPGAEGVGVYSRSAVIRGARQDGTDVTLR